MTGVTITKTLEIELDIDTAAKWFSHISDDDMAQFFCKAAAYCEDWPKTPLSFGPSHMWYLVGRHLVECPCSTDKGRAMIRDIYNAMEPER